MINYDGKQFRPVSTQGTSETTAETIFFYSQNGNLLTASYSGGDIESGHLIGTVDENGKIDMRYHHRNLAGKLMSGICRSRPEKLADGKIRLHETWQWTYPSMSEGKSKGTSILEEIEPKGN